MAKQKPIEVIRSMLFQEEAILASISVSLLTHPDTVKSSMTSGRLEDLGLGVLALTHDRFLLVTQALFGVQHERSIRLSTVGSVSRGKDPLSLYAQSFTIHTHSGDLRLTWADGRKKLNEFNEFFQLANNLLSQRGQDGTLSSQGNLDFMNQLTKLAEMHREGLLNAEEFEKAKGKLLG